MQEMKAYRVETRFKEAVELTGPEHLYIRQTPNNTYIITAVHAARGTEYILSTMRNREAAREFSDLGRCVQFAIDLTGVYNIHFQLNPAARTEK